LIISGVYAGAFYSKWGATPGKMLLRLTVYDSDGNNPGFWRGALRDSVGKMLSGLLCAAGYIYMLFDEEEQALHDKLFGTHVTQ